MAEGAGLRAGAAVEVRDFASTLEVSRLRPLAGRAVRDVSRLAFLGSGLDLADLGGSAVPLVGLAAEDFVAEFGRFSAAGLLFVGVLADFLGSGFFAAPLAALVSAAGGGGEGRPMG